jgi:hypothetical protein
VNVPASIAFCADPYVRTRLLRALRERREKTNATFSERGSEILAHECGDSRCVDRLREFCAGFLGSEKLRRT